MLDTTGMHWNSKLQNNQFFMFWNGFVFLFVCSLYNVLAGPPVLQSVARKQSAPETSRYNWKHFGQIIAKESTKHLETKHNCLYQSQRPLAPARVIEQEEVYLLLKEVLMLTPPCWWRGRIYRGSQLLVKILTSSLKWLRRKRKRWFTDTHT